MSADPTMEFVQRLADPNLWVIRRGVPIFKPHEQAFPEMRLSDGRIIPARVNKVTEADLLTIASNMQKAERSATFPVARIGHFNQDPLAKEAEQPETIGVYVNPRVGTFGPKDEPCILADEYILPEKDAARKNLLHRSSEYFGQSKTIKGIALLARPPMLDMGMVGFADGEFAYHYSMGAMGPTNAAPPPPPADEFTPEQKALYEGMRRYMCTTYGLDQNWPAQLPTPEGNAVADANTPDPNKPGPVTPMQNQEVAALYQQFEAFKTQSAGEKQALAAQLDGLRLERDHERCQAMIDTLRAENYQLTPEEVTKEVGKLAKLPIAERDDRVKEVRAIYAERKVPGGMIDLYHGLNEPGSSVDPKDPYGTPWYHEQAKQYMMQHIGTTYAAACSHVQATAAKK